MLEDVVKDILGYSAPKECRIMRLADINGHVNDNAGFL